jgi:hypothetical protein
LSFKIKDVKDLPKKIAKKPVLLYGIGGAVLLGVVVLMRGGGGSATTDVMTVPNEQTGNAGAGGSDASYYAEINEALTVFGTEVSDAMLAQNEAINAVLAGVVQENAKLADLIENVSQENEDLWSAIRSVTNDISNNKRVSSTASKATSTENKISPNTGDNNSSKTFQYEVGNTRWSPEAGGYIDKDTAALVSKDPVWK